MPIPTDTFWNIKKLNVVFALSAVVLLAVTFWAVVQDHGKDWRIPQQQARVWDAALTTDKIQGALTEADKALLADLEKQIADKASALASGDKAYKELLDQRRKIQSDRATLEFKLNNIKSNVQVAESQLQDAITANNTADVERLQKYLEAPRKEIAAHNETLAKYTDQLTELRKKIDAQTLQIDELKAQRTKIAGEYESQRKKLVSLDPKEKGGIEGLLGAVSSHVRDAPLMGFMNPAQRVQQIVLSDVQTDVAFMKITTVDRCITCHVNISNKEFTEPKVLAYLEEQMAIVRQMKLPKVAPAGATAPSATSEKPGPAAAPAFWHLYAQKLAPSLIQRYNPQLSLITNNAASADVTYEGQPVPRAVYDRTLTDPAAIAKQNDVLLALMQAYGRWSADADGVGEHGKAKATIAKSATVTGPRNQALRYPELVRDGLKALLSAEDWKLLEDRYRYTLVGDLNVARKAEGRPALDASPVLLAHPSLELYVDVDSPHAMEAVGCTSCHDGSGQETDFVLAAHMARNIKVDSRTGAPVLEGQLKEHASGHHEQEDLSSMLEAVSPAHGALSAQVAKLHFENAPATQPAEGAAGGHGEAHPVAYIDPVTGHEGQALDQLEYWKKIYEPKAPRNFALVYHEWDWPMRAPQYLQANCARCHTEVYDIKETAPVLYQGRQLFTQMGCVNCHQMDSIPATQNRKVGTDLRHVTAKLSPEYINSWIWAPKAFRPTTKMPHFFMLENNSSDEELKRTRQEARAITEYLVRSATPLPPSHEWPSSGQGNAANGKALFNTLGCLACHQNLNERGEEWITLDLQKRAGMEEDAAKAAYAGMSYNERQVYVQQHLAEPTTVNAAPKYADGTAKPTFVQVGPELSGIGTKLSANRTPAQARGWLFDWLIDPQHYSSYTFMPKLRLNEQQAMDLSEYLLSQKRTTAAPNDQWAAGLTPTDSEKLKELTALQLKSRFSADTARLKADEDAELISLATAALTTPVKPEAVAKAEAEKMSKDDRRLVFLGQKMIAHYGCMSCHAINGMESVSSPCANLSDWGQKGVDKLDYGYIDHHKVDSLPKINGMPKPAEVPLINGLSVEAANLGHAATLASAARDLEVGWPDVAHNRQSWITQKLKNSRIYDRGKVLLEPKPEDKWVGSPYDKLKMPTFYLNEEQVHAIVTFVLSNRNRLISERLTARATNEQATLIARGRELTERYNCISCHQTEKNAPQIRQYFTIEDIPTKSPPSLRGEGNKVQFAWLFNFFKHVEPLRPLINDGIRMPSFPLTDVEWSAIIAYFNSISNKESHDLARRLDPINKYIASARGATSQPSSNPDEVWPGDDWWQRNEFLATADYLKVWGLDFGHIKPVEIAPGTSADDYRKLYRTLLFKANFTRDLYAAAYPFVDSPRPQIAQDRFARGEQFLYELQCLKCHVMGDPSIPGANKSPTAPNLTLTHVRLQQRWVRAWVQEPGIIQTGTAMPPFFTGLPVFNLEGQSTAMAQSLSDPAQQQARVDLIHGRFGATARDQTGLLLDFLYAAGARGHTGVQPPTTAPAAAAASQ